ncbi:MAG TPA: hypothetical protein VLZ75_05190 [Chitinophagales bacterium]|nr:hypothetical protein [Chitinophagales bacterium]
MKNLPILAFLILVLSIGSCKKDSDKTSGICYCKYLSGDKKEFDLRDLPRSQQIDSCYLFNKNAAYFAGDCELK